MQIFNEFINSYFLWKDPMLIGLVSGAVCGFTGVYVVLRRMVFISATLTQISSLGVVLAFYFQSVIVGTFFGLINPFYFSIVLTCISAVFFSMKRDFFPITLEGVIGFGFLIAGSLTIIMSDRITQGAHEVDNILFGSAVVVDNKDLIFIPAISIVVFFVHYFFYKDFVFISFDPEMAKLFGYPVRIINLIMFIILGTVVAVTTRALGALPVFALLALPPLTSMYLTEKLKYVFILSILIGMSTAATGYFLSFIMSMPTGASVVLAGSVIFIICHLYSRFKKVNTNAIA